MKKTILIVLLLSVGFSQRLLKEKNEIITERHDNGLKKLVLVFEGTGINETLIGKYGFYDDGLKQFIELYKNNKKHGKSLYWYDNGNKKKEGTFKDGEWDGKWTEWYENGNKKNEETFKDGKLVEELLNMEVAEESIILENAQDSISYSIGMEIGENFQTQSVEVNPDVFAQGFDDAYTESTPLLKDSEVRIITQNYRQKLRSKQDELRKQQLEENKVGGEKFLSENSTKEEVIVLPSGLQYKVLNNGDGSTPKATDKVKVHYTGKLIDGTVFDSSVESGKPYDTGVTQVIKGWTEALQLMQVGDKWELYIPSNLAYGARGKGPKIGPNTTLIFEVELLGIE